MVSLSYRMLFGGLLFIGLITLAQPTPSRAQDKDNPESVLSFATSDGLALGALWYPPKDKPSADAVIMFPRPGQTINKTWIGLAEAMQAKGFAVLLFDFRGLGMNGPLPNPKAKDQPDPPYLKGRGERIVADSTQFFNEAFNRSAGFPRTIEKNGLNYKTFTDRQKDAIYNDLQAARFFLDKKNDAKICNTNRIWLVTEKEGYQVALAFWAHEYKRPSIFPEQNKAAIVQNDKASKDYAGIVCFSPNENNAVATQQINKYLANRSFQDVQTALQHIEKRMSIIAVYGKSEGNATAKRIISKWGVPEAEFVRRYKYLMEFDNTKVKGTPTGIDLIDATDSLKVRADLVQKMFDTSNKGGQDFGKEETKRNAIETKTVPRSPILDGR